MMQNIADETITHRHSTRASAVPVRQYGSFLPGPASAARANTGTAQPGDFFPPLHPAHSFDQETRSRQASAADLAVQDWGVTYDELEPHYWRAEQLMGVGGKAGT